MRQDVHVRVRPINERTVHPDFSLRLHDEADYSSGFEEASSKRAAEMLSSVLLLAVRADADVSSDEIGKTMGRIGRHVFDPQSELVLVRPADRCAGNLQWRIRLSDAKPHGYLRTRRQRVIPQHA
jgi:hypothetical protein